MLYAMISHGFSPDGFNISSIQPLVKNKRKPLNDSSNYRAIALSSPLSKVFDWVILNKYSCQFETSDSQYGFKVECHAPPLDNQWKITIKHVV